MYKIVRDYIFENKIVFVVGLYLVLSSVLKAMTQVDICIPCVWKSCFGFHCPGCGLTTAFVALLKLNFTDAFKANWLIFLILPAGIYLLMHDFNRFKKRCKAKDAIIKQSGVW